MATQKQIEANQQNALLSTGAKTEAGKAIVAKNAIKHGIFTNELIIDTIECRENATEYNAILDNLIAELEPQGQMQQLLVEKIAADFWRLKRVFRFENGDISKHITQAISSCYNHAYIYGEEKCKNNFELDDEIKENQERVEQNDRCLMALKQNKISLENSSWKNEQIEIDLENDLLEILGDFVYEKLTASEQRSCENCDIKFAQIKKIFTRLNISAEEINNYLIQLHKNRNRALNDEIKQLEQQKLGNLQKEAVAINANILPSYNTSDKVMRYEQALQKSIFQNLLMLKKLQESKFGFVL